jgi:hypothetical protein
LRIAFTQAEAAQCVKGANIIMIIEGTLSSSVRKKTPEFIELRERKWTAATLRSRKAPTIDSA